MIKEPKRFTKRILVENGSTHFDADCVLNIYIPTHMDRVKFEYNFNTKILHILGNYKKSIYVDVVFINHALEKALKRDEKLEKLL